MASHKQLYYNYNETNHKKLPVNEHNKNKRYKYFKQTNFTAGDVDQFTKHIVRSNQEIDNTFKYLYHKFKKGIYIRIENGEVKTFLPFSKNIFINEWANLLDMKTYEIDRIMKYSNKMYSNSKYDKNVEKWFANNCLVRNEYPLKEGESGVNEMRNMFEELCKNRKIKDVSFFVNRRDFPLLRKDRTEPYECIFGENVPLVSHKYEKYCPILSMNSNNNFDDISIPTWEDWDRISSKHKRFFPPKFRNYNDVFDTNWEDKKDIAIFRGKANGRGIDEYTNMRLKISKIKHIYLDAGITEFNMRPRIFNEDGKCKIKNINTSNFNIVNSLTPEEQSKYKYVVNIEGHSAAYRLSLELSMGCVILLVDCKYKLWYFDKLVEYVHYVPVKGDLSDLIEKIEWCRNNDDKCKEIAHNSKIFYDNYLCENGIYDHLEKVINGIDEQTDIVDIYTDNNKKYKRMLMNNHIDIIGDKISEHKNISVYCNESGKFIVKTGDILHEAIVGLKCLNKLDGFVKTLGINDYKLILENIDGIKFDEWIRTKFEWNKYIIILSRIFHILKNARENYEFIHYDLSPWNIIIKSDNEPVIIDFGKSKIKYRSRYYCVYDHKDYTVDIFSILIKTISVITEKFITNPVLTSNLLKLTSVLSYNTIKNIFELKQFIKTRTNYDNIIFGDCVCNLSELSTIINDKIFL